MGINKVISIYLSIYLIQYRSNFTFQLSVRRFDPVSVLCFILLVGYWRKRRANLNHSDSVQQWVHYHLKRANIKSVMQPIKHIQAKLSCIHLTHNTVKE